MRNLKRALSLTLASVMLLGMMVVGTSALSFNDADDISNVTAASVLEDLGIMQGDGSGNFMPDRPVTRAQMAIIICRILYGNKLNVSQFEGTTQYTDVAAAEYYTGYINLATQLGIIGGYGDGRFGPNDTVTTAQAALMLSRALGYFKGNEIAQAQDWALAAVAQATKINMFGELKLATNAELARDNVAEMVFNAITATVPVQYNELLGVYYNENQGIIYALDFNYLETLGYKNFDLVYRDDTQDIYGRPARTWGTGTYNTRTNQGTGGTQAREDLDAEGGLIASRVRMLDKNEIITVALTPDYVYTEEKDQDEVWKDLGRSICNESKDDKDKGYTWVVYNNGEKLYEDGKVEPSRYGYGSDPKTYVPRNEDGKYKLTGKGAQTEIYVDDGDSTVTVVEINYYIGEVTRVSDDTITVKPLSLEPTRLNIRTAKATGYDVEDLVVFTVDENEDEDFYICETFQPDTATGTIKRVESDDRDNHDNGAWFKSYVRFEVGGEKYPYSGDGHMVFDLDELNVKQHPTLEEEYTLYRDPNGYVLAYKLAEEETLNYLYVKDADEEMDDWMAKVIYTDATTKKVEVKDEVKGDGAFDKVQWIKKDEDYNKADKTNIEDLVWKYSKNSSDVHTLTWVDGKYLVDKDNKNAPAGHTDVVEIKNGNAYIGTGYGRVIVDQKTVFVDVDNEKSYTGFDAVPNVKNAEIIYVLDKKGVADVVFILSGGIYDDGFYFTLEGDARESWLRGGKGGDEYWHYTKSYVDGEKEDIYVSYGYATAGRSSLVEGVLYKATRIEEEDGIKYLEKVVPVADFRTVEYTEASVLTADTTERGVQNMRVNGARKNGYSFSLTSKDGQSVLQYTTNPDTVFVLVEENYSRRNDCANDGWTVSKGSINDLEVIDYDEKLNTYVTVAQEDGNEVAEIVYILRTNTRYPVEITNAAGETKTYWAKMTKWNPDTDPEVSISIPASDVKGVMSNPQVVGGVNGLEIDKNGNLTGTVTVTNPDILKITVDVDESGSSEQGKYTVTINVTGFVEEKVEHTNVEDKATGTIEWTVPANTKATYDGKDYKTGEKISIPYTVNGANLTFEVTTVEVKTEYTLTLTGISMVNAKVYVDNNNITSQGVPSLTGTTFKIAAGSNVMVEETTVITESGTVNLKGTDNDGKAVEIKATSNSVTGRMSFTMDGNVTLKDDGVAATYAVKIMDENIESLKFKAGATEKTVTKEGDTYFVKAADNVTVIEATMKSGATITNAIAIGTPGFSVAEKDSVYHVNGSDGKGLAIDVTGNTGSLSSDLYVYSAARVDFDNTTAAGKFTFLGQNIGNGWQKFYVAPGFTMTVGKNGGDALIKKTGASAPECAAYADALKGTETIDVKVDGADMDLYGAYRVNVHGVDADANIAVGAATATIKSGDFVVIGTTIKNEQSIGGSTVYLVDEAQPCVVGDADASDDTLSVDFSFTNLYVATKLTLTANSKLKLLVQESNGAWVPFATESGSAVTVYVKPNTTVRIQYEEGDGKTITFTKASGETGDLPASAVSGKMSVDVTVNETDMDLGISS